MKVALVVASLVCTGGSLALAEEAPPPLARLKGQVVRVQPELRGTLKGVVSAVDATHLTLALADGRSETFRLGEITTLERRRGFGYRSAVTLVGGAVGAFVGVTVPIAVCINGSRACDSLVAEDKVGRNLALFAAGGAALGAVLACPGVFFDYGYAHVSHRVRGGRVDLSARVVPSRHGVAALTTLRF